MSSRYNHKIAEKKWQKEWIEQKIFETKKDISKKKILCFRNVSIPVWKNSHGSRKKLYAW